MTARVEPRSEDPRGVPQRVIEAATALFAEQGYESTSVQQIVSRAGVTKGAMYHYFSSKDELLAGTYAQLLDLQNAHLVDIVGRDLPALDRVRLVGEDLVRTTLEHLDNAIVFHRSLHLLSDPSRASFREERRRYREIFEQLLLDGMESGEIRADLKIDLASFSFFGAIGYLTFWYSPDGPRTIEEIATGYADLLIASLT